jgi:hypothetical protein
MEFQSQKTVVHIFVTPLVRVLEKLIAGQVLRNSLSLMFKELEGSLNVYMGLSLDLS